MPIAVKCQCGKALNVRDDLAGKAIKCPDCQQVIKVPAGAAKAPAARPSAAGPPSAKPPVPRPAGSKPAGQRPAGSAPTASRPAAPARPAVGGLPASADANSMDSLFAEAGFEVRTGQFCPACNQLLKPGAVLCTQCGFHLETGTLLQGHKAETAELDNAEGALKRAEMNMKRAQELDDKLQAAGMPPWMMAMILFILSSCTAVAVIAVNVSRRSKDDNVSFNAVATMLMLAGIAFTAVAIGSGCIVLYRAFKDSGKQGMLVMFVPFYMLYYGFKRYKYVGKTVIVFILTAASAAGLFVLASMSNAGKL